MNTTETAIMVERPLTIGEIEEAVRELAFMFPHVVYNDHLPADHGPCHYSPDADNVFGCIVGAAITHCGGDPETVLTIAGAEAALGVTQAEGKWLRNVQLAQDRRVPWREAVAMADLLAYDHPRLTCHWDSTSRAATVNL